MKLSILLTLAGLVAFGQGNYEASMTQAITEVYKAETNERFDQLANKFNRIGQAEADKWEPGYYEALSYLFKSMRMEVPSEKDAVLDQAHAALTRAAEVDDKNSEIVALQGFVDMMKLTVDPASRGQSMTPKIMAAFGTAMGLDPLNPRATLFMAQMQIGTAQFFGSPISEPCSLISRAEELFKNAKPNSPLAPMWGAASISQYKEICEASKSDQ